MTSGSCERCGARLRGYDQRRQRNHLAKAWTDPDYRRRQTASRNGSVRVRQAALQRWRRPEYRARQSAARSAAAKRRWADPVLGRKLAEAAVRNSHYARYEYLDRGGRLYTFKSGDAWERGFARWLDAQGLTWWYEPHVLLLSDGRRYVPDFYVEAWNTYVELKASHRPTDKAQLAVSDGHRIIVLQGLDAIRRFMEEHAAAPV